MVITDPVLSRMYEQTLMCGKHRGVQYNQVTGKEFWVMFGEHSVSVKFHDRLSSAYPATTLTHQTNAPLERPGVTVKIPKLMLANAQGLRQIGEHQSIWGLNNVFKPLLTHLGDSYILYIDPQIDRACDDLAHFFNLCLYATMGREDC